MSKLIEIWTDGACSGNPGPGGWGAVLKQGDTRRKSPAREPPTTNNRMELTAAIEALNALKKPAHVRLHTDSQYVKNGVTQWIHNWKRKGWKTADNKPVANADLWKALETAEARHTVEWRWVRGHDGDVMNERADALAARRSRRFKRIDHCSEASLRRIDAAPRAGAGSVPCGWWCSFWCWPSRASRRRAILQP